MADAEVVIQIKGDSKEYEAAIKGLGQTTQNALSTSIKGSMIGNILANAFSKASSVISSSLDGAISRVDTLNQFPKVMQNIGFSADEAQSSISRMSDGIEGLPTSLDEIVGNTQQLAMSLGDLDQATDVALALNDGFITFGASSADVTSAITQLNQMVNTGKYDMQSWNSINQSAPGYLDAVAKSMLGSSANASQLRDALNNGEVSTQDFLNAIVKMDKEGGAGFEAFSKSAKDASGGIATSMGNVLTAVKKNLANIIQELNSNGEISGAFDTLKAKVNEFGGKVVEAVGWIKENFDTVKPVLVGAFSIFTGGTLISGIGRVSSVVAEFMAKFQAPTLAKAIQGAFSASNFSGGLTAIQIIGTKIGELVTKVGGLSGVLPALSGAFSTAFATIGAKVGSVVTKLGTGLVGAFSKITTVLAGIGAPTLIAVAAIAALVAGMTYFFTQTEQGQAALQQIISILQTGFSQAMATLMPLIQQLGASFQQMGTQLAPVFQQLVASFANIAAQIMPLIAQLAVAVIPILMQIAEVIANVIMAVLPVVIPIITQIAEVVLQVANVALPLITSALQVLLPIISNIITVVTTVVTTIITVVTTVVTAIVNFFTVTIPEAINTVINFFAQLPTNIQNFLTSAIVAVALFVANLIANAVQAGSQFLSNIVNFFSQLPSNIANFLSNAISSIVSFVSNIASQAIQAGTGFLNGIRNGFNSAVSFISSIPGQILGFFSGIGGWLIDSGASLINGLVEGIKSAFGNAISAVQDGLSNLRSLFPFSPAKKGPFSGHGYTSYSGLALMRDFAGGIRNGTKGAVNTAKTALGAIQDTLSSGSLDMSLSTAGASLNGVTSVDILGQSFMDGIEAITSRLDAINSRLANIENKLDKSTSISINGREFGRLVREYQ